MAESRGRFAAGRSRVRVRVGGLSVGLAMVCALVAGCASSGGGTSQAGSSTSAATQGVPTTSGPSRSSSAPATSAPVTSAAPTTPGQGSVPRCHTRDVSGSFKVVENGQSAGHTEYNIQLVNRSSHTCTVYGFPGLLLLDARHAPLPTDVHWGVLTVKRTISLRPGSAASSTAYFSPDVPGEGDNTSPSPGTVWTCEPVATYIEITPPDETSHLIVPVSPPTPVCERGQIGVSELVAGTKGPRQP
ncbi:MAG TPA: DUF4232 domain-containing protein [Actinospica sp.]|nr:DUF4232 domain-containing protein [Actinospica sp.]